MQFLQKDKEMRRIQNSDQFFFWGGRGVTLQEGDITSIQYLS